MNKISRPAWIGISGAVAVIAGFVAAAFLQSSHNGDRVTELQQRLTATPPASARQVEQLGEQVDGLDLQPPTVTVTMGPAAAGAPGPAGAPGRAGAAGPAGQPGQVVTVTAAPRPGRGGLPSAAAPSPAPTVTVTATPEPVPSCGLAGVPVLGVFCQR